MEGASEKTAEQKWQASCVLRRKKVFATVPRRRRPRPWEQLGEGAEARTSWSTSLGQLVLCYLVAQSCLTLRPHGLQHSSLPCPSLSPSCCCCCVASVVPDSVRPHRRQPTRLPRPWDSPGKNTGVCCHFLLQYMKVKSESEVAQSCPTLSDPMGCSLPGSSVHGVL